MLIHLLLVLTSDSSAEIVACYLAGVLDYADNNLKIWHIKGLLTLCLRVPSRQLNEEKKNEKNYEAKLQSYRASCNCLVVLCYLVLYGSLCNSLY